MVPLNKAHRWSSQHALCDIAGKLSLVGVSVTHGDSIALVLTG